MNGFEKIIKDYLDKRASEDAMFAAKYNGRCGKEEDAVAGCCDYIKAEARKQAQNNCAVIEDREVFGWAVHYFDEDIRRPENAPKAKVAAAPAAVKEDKEKKAEKPVQKLRDELKAKAVEKPKVVEPEWPSLFGFDEEDE